MDREGLWRRQSICEDAIAGGTQVALPDKEHPVLPVFCKRPWKYVMKLNCQLPDQLPDPVKLPYQVNGSE